MEEPRGTDKPLSSTYLRADRNALPVPNRNAKSVALQRPGALPLSWALGSTPGPGLTWQEPALKAGHSWRTRTPPCW